MKERNKFMLMAAAFLGCFYLPVEILPFKGPVFESIALVKWYAREHVLLCLVPAFFIAGAISVFVSQASVIKYFGAKANKFLAYTVAAVSGTILAVCSCTVLPLFSGIYKRGAGLGPAAAFLYSGPAINVLAIIMTARILGWELGVARAFGAMLFSVAIGLLMHLIFIKEERARVVEGEMIIGESDGERPLWKNALYFAAMVGFLVFANWARPQAGEEGFWAVIFAAKWFIAGGFLIMLGIILVSWFKKDEISTWASASWTFAKQIMPLLLMGVLVAGLLLGRPGEEGLIPSSIIEKLVGGNSFWANFFASVVGALMYFATLTEVPILQGLIGAGMGKGPALALLLAGPALSLPNMLVIRGVIGTKKTVVYVSLVVVMATISGIIFGTIIS
ncbi:MAG: permease [Candidatus Omnitrophica bacterium]|nr:permease [Candidatus Omnitrophota bacterium]